MTGAARLLDRLDAGWRPFRAAVDHIGLRHFHRPTPVGWDYAALVEHVAAWHDVTADRLAALRSEGAFRPPPDVDAFNAEAARVAQGRSGPELLARLDRSFTRLRSEVEQLGEAQLAANDGWADQVVAGNSFGHYEEHRPELAAARPATVAALLARLDEDSAVFREAVERIAVEGRLEEAAAGEWTFRDVAAHAAAWMVEAVRVLPEYRAGRPSEYTSDDVERFNAAAVTARRDLDEGELLGELDGAFGDLRRAAADLRDDELADRQILGLVAWCSYLHFDEHLAELGVPA